MLDIEAFRSTALVREPFPYLIVPGFLKAEARAAVHQDYPEIAKPGSFPTTEVEYGPAFAGLLAEVPPDEGTLVAFLVTPNSWHGHGQFVGPRRVIQLNWVTGEDVVKHEQARHRFSARMKKLLSFAS